MRQCRKLSRWSPYRSKIVARQILRSFKHCSVILGLSAAAATSAVAQQVTSSPWAFVKWRSIGPVNTSGRIDDIAVARVKGEADAIYVATASGGLWKSANNGISWSPVFDDVDAMMSIGAVAVAPSAPADRVARHRRSQHATELELGRRRLQEHRRRQDVGEHGTQGHALGRAHRHRSERCERRLRRRAGTSLGAERRARRVQDDRRRTHVEEGAVRRREHRRDRSRHRSGESAGAVRGDVSAAAAGRGASTAAARARASTRRPTAARRGRSSRPVCPSGDKGRIGLSLYATDPKVVYATIEARARGTAASIARSTPERRGRRRRRSTRGPTTTRRSASTRAIANGSTRSARIADSISRMTAARRSPNCSATCTVRITRCGWIPTTRNHLIIGGDGGISISWDRGRTWDFRRNMPIGQFYEVDVDNSVPFRICGGLQDNGVWCVPSAVRNRNGIADRDAWNIGGGDGFHAHFDPTNNAMVLQSSQNGNAAWVNIETLERQGVRPGTGDRPAPGGGGRGGRGGGRGAAAACRGAEEGAGRRRWTRRRISLELGYADRRLASRSQDVVHGRAGSVQEHRSRIELAEDQRRSHAERRSRHAQDDGKPSFGRTRCRATTASRTTARSRRSANRR